MFSLLKNFYSQVEQTKGSKLLYLLLAIFILFLVTGVGLGYITNSILNKSEATEVVNTADTTAAPVYMEGTVSYVNSGLYPEDNISFSLVDGSGKEIILLKSKDQKLVVTEGHKVKVKGKVLKTKNGQSDYLLVEEVIIQNDL